METTKKASRKSVEQQLVMQERATANIQRELEKRNETVDRLKGELKRVRESALSAAADYKARFDKLQEEVAAVAAARQQAVQDLHEAQATARAEKAELERRIQELNYRLGERLRLLQEDLEQEKETNGQVLVFAAGSSGWENLDPISVGAKMVKDLREENEEKSKVISEFEEFAESLKTQEESVDTANAE